MKKRDSDSQESVLETPVTSGSPYLEAIITRLQLILQRWHGYDSMREDSTFADQAQSVLTILRDVNGPTDAEVARTIEAIQALQSEYPPLRERVGLGHYANQVIEYIQR